MLSESRIGNFTSSEIFNLCGFDKSGKDWGASAMTYIAEKNNERRLQSSINEESNAKPLSWGKLCEKYLNNTQRLLGLEYEILNDVTYTHPLYNYWKGSPDNIKHLSPMVIGDTKAPITKASFCGLVNPYYLGLRGLDCINAIRNGFTDAKGFKHAKHKDGDKYYWQLVSNACILGAYSAELQVFMPYESELQTLKDLADGDGNLYWMMYSDLPFIKDGGFYKNITKIEFEVPQSDKDFLTERVLMAEKFLIK